MELHFSSAIIPAFLAGMLTFLAPCTFPLVPGYLSFISGVSLPSVNDPVKRRGAKWRIFFNGVFFVVGFSMVFISFGMVAGFAGTALGSYRIWSARIGGAFVILFGLLMLNVLKLPFLQAEKRIRIPSFLERGKPLTSLILGSAFASGWTPCVGPVLGSILFFASSSATVLQGGLLLGIFSLGLGIPFLAMAAGIGHASRFVARISRFLNIVSIVGGIFLIFIGILLITNRFVILIPHGYRLFRFINYERLLDYL